MFKKTFVLYVAFSDVFLEVEVHEDFRSSDKVTYNSDLAVNLNGERGKQKEFIFGFPSTFSLKQMKYCFYLHPLSLLSLTCINILH